MHTITKRLHESEDEEDLEFLRLEALKSLKKPAVELGSVVPFATITTSTISETQPIFCNTTSYNGPHRGINKRGRYHGNGRITRNGLYNNKLRNCNLISVQTIEPDAQPEQSYSKKFANELPPKLILPQDRYCGSKVTSDDKSLEACSKFDRYNDSDKSGTDSESEGENTPKSEIASKSEPTTSLEALLQQLDNVIQGNSNILDEVVKPKTNATMLQIDNLESIPLKIPNILYKVKKVETQPKVLESKKVELQLDIEEQNKDTIIPLEKKQETQEQENNPHISNSNITAPFVPVSVQSQILQNTPLQPVAYVNPSVPAVSTILPYAPSYSNFSVPMYNNSLPYPFPNSITGVVEPCRRTCTISPLTIKTEILNAISAPLSPRSAAFVLQNREIVERRKKSPRHSYSRSPTPEYGRPLSPRYRRSPKRSPKLSPIHRSPARSMTRRLSPKKSSNSRHCSPKHTTGSPRKVNWNIRNEIQTTNSAIRSEDHNRQDIQNRGIAGRRSSSPESTRSGTNSPVDAILEARRKKFETGITVVTEGVIRLKPKLTDEDGIVDDQKCVEEQTELIEDALLGGDEEIDLGVCITSNDIFSDEESDSGNEGRFKSTQNEANCVTKLPFTQLLNETSKMIRKEKLNGDKTTYGSRSNLRISRRHGTSKDRMHRSYSPEIEKDKMSKMNYSSLERKPLHLGLQLNIDSRGPKRKPPIENKKIEIRIRNPSKYGSASTNKIDSTEVRKIEVTNVDNNGENLDDSDKIFIESDDESKNEGDLRTQLSRKRAVRQYKVPTVDGIQSRLLQNALKGAIYKKSLKANKEKEVAPLDNVDGSLRGTTINATYGVGDISCSTDRKVKVMHYGLEQLSTAADGKLPIHLRLGTPGSMDIFPDTTVQTNSRIRSKNRGNLDQV